jgi:hypothetical protein
MCFAARLAALARAADDHFVAANAVAAAVGGAAHMVGVVGAHSVLADAAAVRADPDRDADAASRCCPLAVLPGGFLCCALWEIVLPRLGSVSHHREVGYLIVLACHSYAIANLALQVACCVVGLETIQRNGSMQLEIDGGLIVDRCKFSLFGSDVTETNLSGTCESNPGQVAHT